MKRLLHGGGGPIGGQVDYLGLAGKETWWKVVNCWWRLSHSQGLRDCMRHGYLSHEEDPE